MPELTEWIAIFRGARDHADQDTLDSLEIAIRHLEASTTDLETARKVIQIARRHGGIQLAISKHLHPETLHVMPLEDTAFRGADQPIVATFRGVGDTTELDAEPELNNHELYIRAAFRGVSLSDDPSSNVDTARAAAVSADPGTIWVESVEEEVGIFTPPATYATYLDSQTPNSVSTDPDTPIDSSVMDSAIADALIAELDAIDAPAPASRRSRKPEPKANPSAYASEAEVREAFTRADYAAHLGYPLNTAITYLLPWHDDWFSGRTTLDLIESLADKITSFFRHRRLPCTYLAKIENKRGGGAGLHLHILLHIPVADYAQLSFALEKNLVQDFATRIKRRACRAGIWKPHKRLSIHQAYQALLSRKQAATRRASAASSDASDYRQLSAATRNALHEAATMARAVSHMTTVPVMFSWRDGKPYHPIITDRPDELVPYLTKDADPKILILLNGTMVSLGDNFRSPTGADWHPQSDRRPKLTLRSSASLHPNARRCDPRWTEPTVNLGERLLHSERDRIKREHTTAAIDRLHIRQ